MVASIQNHENGSARVLRLSITGECNLNCFYCKPIGKSRDLIPVRAPIQPSDVTKLVKIVGEMGVTKVIIGGGEPLLRKDAPNFVKSAYAHKGIQEVRLVTNGTYLKAYADMLRKLGLRRVDINFASLNFQKYQRITERDDLFRVLDGIEKVEKLNYPDIRLNVYLFNGINQDEIVDFARITKDRKLHLRFMEYRPSHGTETEAHGERLGLSVADALRMIDNYQHLSQVHDLTDELSAPSYKFAGAAGRMSFLGEQELRAEASVPTVVFTADGALFNENGTGRPTPILEDLRRDAKEARLHRLIEKILAAPGAAPKKKSEKVKTKTRVAATTSRSRSESSPRRAAAGR